MSDYAITAHAHATARMLRRIVAELERGRAPEELGEQVVDLGLMMKRRT